MCRCVEKRRRRGVAARIGEKRGIDFMKLLNMTDTAKLLVGEVDGDLLFGNGDIDRHGNRDDERRAKQEKLSSGADVSQHDAEPTSGTPGPLARQRRFLAARKRRRAEVALSPGSMKLCIRVPSRTPKAPPSGRILDG